LTHLWLGQTGISGARAENKAETFCNDVASEILLPQEELATLTLNRTDFNILTQDITDFAQARKISSALVSYRLFRHGTISIKLWATLSDHFTKQWLDSREKIKNRNKQQEGGPSYFVVRRHNLGDALVRFAERMFSSGVLTPTKVGLLLGIRPLKVHKLFEPSSAV
jgi:Zn-dependent peptidase ImmA (M78 family)